MKTMASLFMVPSPADASLNIGSSPHANDAPGFRGVVLLPDREGRRQTERSRAQVQVADLAEFDVVIVPCIRISGCEQELHAGLPELIKGSPDRLVREMNHEITCEPCLDVRKRIAKNVEFHEFDAGVFAAVLDDEIRDDVGPDIFEAAGPLHVAHPVKVAAGRVKQ